MWCTTVTPAPINCAQPRNTEKNSCTPSPWAYFTNGPNAAASIAPTLIRHWSWVRVSLAAGRRVATVGQLLFAPRAWAYSTLHPFGVGKWVPASAGKGQRQVCATLLGARHVGYRSAPEVAVSTWGAITNVELFWAFFKLLLHCVSKKWGTHIMPHNSHKCGPILIFLSL